MTERMQLSCQRGYKMDTKTKCETHGKIMQRVAKTPLNIYGTTPAETIPINKPSIIAFGGERTYSTKEANHYASVLEALVRFYKIKDIDIYSAYYEFENDSWDRKPEREKAFISARSKILNKIHDSPVLDTQYINDLYNIVIHPRIVDANGNRFSDDVAVQNVRNAIFYTHCHGATTVRTFQNIMARDMREHEYDPHAIREIMRNVLVIQHAPVAPLERSKFNTISFMSANDTQMNFYNKFSEYVSDHTEDLFPAYFSLGNFFAVYGFTHQLINEHQIVGLVPTHDQDMLTPDGAIIMASERNTIINGINAARNHKPIPDVRDLIVSVNDTDTVRPDFDELTKNGEMFMRIMRHNIHNPDINER